MASVNTNSFELLDNNSFIRNTFVDNSIENPSWVNTNSVVMDPLYSVNGMNTVNKNYLPKDIFNITPTNYSSISSITTPPNYLPATLKIFKGGNEFKTIPILFAGSFSNTISATYTRETPVGSTQPIIAFEHTDAESFPFSFVALSDYLPGAYKGSGLNAYLEDIKEMVKPNYSGQTVYSPTVLLSFAGYSVLCVCTSINISFDEIYNNNSFVKANITCEFTRIES